jgi:hypothetical protein
MTVLQVWSHSIRTLPAIAPARNGLGARVGKKRKRQQSAAESIHQTARFLERF